MFRLPIDASAAMRRVVHLAWCLSIGVVMMAVAPLACAADEAAPSLNAQLHRPRIGLVLSGGGARGAAHIGVLKVLEELRVPVDVIAGTSMGAIVGASYASGASIEEMEAGLARLSTAALFTDDPPRNELSMRRKAEEVPPYVGPQFGIDAQGMRLPKGVVSGISLEAVLRELALAKGARDFDRLPIPFRAVATDIETGGMVVFRDGELASAMRASMSVPGLVAPAEVNGRLLVDGGLTRNLPVDVAREMGADVIIAVNLGTPLLRRDQLGSIVGISAQMIAILTEQNVQHSLAQLRSDDILITPALGDFSAGDFDNMRTAVPIGEKAAHELAARLSKLSLPPAEYAALRARQQAFARGPERVISIVRVEGTHVVNPDVIVASMATRAGAVFDQALLDADLRRLYGSGDFEHVGYRLEDVDDQRVLTIDVREKSWGPNYLRFGLGLQSDLRGESTFDLYASYRRTWINALGGEFRADARLGRENRIGAEFHQPLDITQRFYVAPHAEALRRPFEVYSDDVRVARFDENTLSVGFDVGADLGHTVDWRTGPVVGKRRFTLEIGPSSLTPANATIGLGAWRTIARLDALDNLDFPRHGASGRAEIFSSHTSLGGEANYTRWQAEGLKPFTTGPHTVQIGLKSGGAIGGDPIPLYDQFRLGGPLELSGYQPGQILTDSMTLARVSYMGKIFDEPLLRGAFAGLSLEAARVGATPLDTHERKLLTSVATFLSLDSPLGPLYFGLGFAPGGNRAGFVFLGRP